MAVFLENTSQDDRPAGRDAGSLQKPPGALGIWLKALENYARALRAYVAVIDAVAQKSRPAAREVYRQALDVADEAGGVHPPPAGLEGEQFAREAFSAFARLTDAGAALDAGVAAALDPGLLAEALLHMSRSFSEDVDRMARALRKAKRAAGVAAAREATALAAEWAGPVIAGSPDAIFRAYSDSPRSAAGAGLYARVLSEWARAGHDTKKREQIFNFIERAKNEALEVNDVPAETAIQARAGMHPLQAMEISFLLTPGETMPAEFAAGVVIDATLPQAETAVRYDLAPLIDVRVAAKYGKPIAAIYAGINFNLVNRLRTITEEPRVFGENVPRARLAAIADGASGASGTDGAGLESLSPPTRPPARIIVSGESSAAAGNNLPSDLAGESPSVVRTIDGGATYQRMTRTTPNSSDVPAFSTVGAGPRPRVARLGELLEEAVFESATPPKTIRDAADLLEKYEAQEIESYMSLDELGQRLIALFARVYDAAPPTSAETLKNAILGEQGSRDIYRTYIAQALTEATRSIELRLLRYESSGPQSLFGSRSAAVRGGRQEILLTSIVQLKDSIIATRKALGQAYEKIDARAREVFREARRAAPVFGENSSGDFRSKRGDDFRSKRGETRQKVRGLPLQQDARQRQTILDLYRQVVEAAFYSSRAPRASRAARVVEKGGSVEPRASLKLYVLEQGDISGSPVRLFEREF